MKFLKIVTRYKRPLFFAGLFGLFFVYSLTTMDLDFGWHLRSGGYFLENGIPATDVFTYTATNFPWVNHEWLSDILVSQVYNIGGYTLLALLYAGLWTSAIALVSKKVPISVVLVAAIALLPFLGVRALTWSAFFLALLMTLLAAKNKNYLYFIPPLMLLWASMHGSFLIGFAYGAWVLFQKWSWKLFILGVIAFGLTFCTPYGYHLYVEVFRTILDSNLSGIVIEWARFSLPITSVLYILLWLGLLISVNGKQWKRYIRFDSLLLIWSVLSVRMTPLFIIVSLSQMPELLNKIAAIIPNDAKERSRKVARIGVILLLVTTIGIQIFVSTAKVNGESVLYPSKAVAYLKDNPCSGNLFNSYNFGGYLISELPSHKVYIDGRMPSWRYEGKNYLGTYLSVLNNPEVRESEFKTYTIKCVLIDNDSPLVSDLKQEGWKIQVDDGYSSLLTN